MDAEPWEPSARAPQKVREPGRYPYTTEGRENTKAPLSGETPFDIVCPPLVIDSQPSFGKDGTLLNPSPVEGEIFTWAWRKEATTAIA